MTDSQESTKSANATDLAESSPKRDPLGGAIDWTPFEQPPAPFMTFSKEVELPDGPKVLCRLPNPFQHRDIQKHARAARARRVMEHKADGSDAHATVAEQIAEFEVLTDEGVASWLLSRHENDALFQAQMEMDAEEIGDGDDAKQKWPDIDSQLQRYHHLVRSQETESDEFKVLEAFLIDYAKALEDQVQEQLEPYRALYDALSREELIDKVRRAIIKADCDDEFLNVYSQWQIFYGTRNADNPNTTHFKSYEELLDADGRVAEMLTNEFAKLDALKAGELKDFQRATSSLASLAQSENSGTGE